MIVQCYCCTTYVTLRNVTQGQLMTTSTPYTCTLSLALFRWCSMTSDQAHLHPTLAKSCARRCSCFGVDTAISSTMCLHYIPIIHPISHVIETFARWSQGAFSRKDLLSFGIRQYSITQDKQRRLYYVYITPACFVYPPGCRCEP